MPLTDRAIATTKPRGKAFRLSDGAGLLLEVQPSGRRTWIVRFQLAGRRRDMGLGAYPVVSLASARKLAKEAAAHVEAGRDPIAERDRARREAADRDRREEAARARTFRDVAEALVTAQSPGWSSEKTLQSWRLTLDRHAYPAIGEVPIAEVGRGHVVAVLSPLWTARPATAKKLQRRVAAVLDYAAAHQWRSTDNPAAGRVLRLTKALPAPGPSKQQPSLPWQRVPAFLAALDGMEGIAPLCLRWTVLTAVRSAEARGARWSEVDVPNRLWSLAPARVKGGRRHERGAHRVPITDPMLDLLLKLAALRTGERVEVERLPAVVALLGNAPVFPAPGCGILSDMSLTAILRRMNDRREEGAPLPWADVDGRGAVVHGFRRSFRTWVDDTRPETGEAAEKALAHDDRNAVRAAYRGSDMLDQRRPLMTAWNAFCASATTAKVVVLQVA